jgi:hypothetical protein
MPDLLEGLRASLYFDQDVPVQLAAMLLASGFDAVTTLDAGNLGHLDPGQLEFACRNERALVTHNRSDFEDLHLEYLSRDDSHFGIIVAMQRRDLHKTRDRILDILNRFDREQLKNLLLYA